MNTRNHIPGTVNANLGARLEPFRAHGHRSLLEDLDVEAAQAVAPCHELAPIVAPAAGRRERSGLINDLKVLFAALGAGGSAVPLGDNGRTARLLAEYAASLRRQ